MNISFSFSKAKVRPLSKVVEYFYRHCMEEMETKYQKNKFIYIFNGRLTAPFQYFYSSLLQKQNCKQLCCHF